MNYQLIYNQLIQNRQLNPYEGYTEKHHIIPKSHGGNDSKENLVRLSAREHFIVHWLLWRIYRDSKMAYAFYIMTWNKHGQRYNNSQGFAEARKANSKARIGKQNFLGKTHSADTKRRISEGHKGKVLSDYTKEKISNIRKGSKASEEAKRNMSIAGKGKKLSDNTKKKLSNSLTGREFSIITRQKMSESHKHKKLSEYTKKKLSEASRGRIHLKITCPHCNKTGGNTSMPRWHFDNCKKLKDLL